MIDFWRSKSRLFAACCLYLLNLTFCCSLNDEGVALLRFKEKVARDPFGALSNWRDETGLERPCSWFGVECSDGHVALTLKDLCLRGTLAPDIGDLVHVKSIILRSNSFSGVIPEEIAKLEGLDLRYNNFSRQLPCQLGNIFSNAILLLDTNELLGSRHSEIQNSDKRGSVSHRKLLQEPPFVRKPMFSFFLFPSPTVEKFSPPPDSSSPLTPAPALAPAEAQSPSPEPLAASPSPSSITPISPPSSLLTPAEGPTIPTQGHSRKNHHRVLIVSAATGGPLLLLLIIGIFFWQSGKVSTVKPWATGLSGQLQKAFITGVPKLNRSELEAACEDFSNVIGSSSLCTLYKGTLSSGVEIAVASAGVESAKDWSRSLEAQFRKKIDTLSKVNHKNFVSLIGYCVEEEPFTRMLVFEYTPNGTLFEHLHIREAEHLNWPMRVRIAMGIAYCLEHMHQLIQPLVHSNLNSSVIYLTEDYAGKISNFTFIGGGPTPPVSEPNTRSNVYNFGVVLFEMVTGKLPYSTDSSDHSLENWALDYLNGAQNLRETVDPTLETYREDELQRIGEVIRSCTSQDPQGRPTMREVCSRMREITGIEPDGAGPRASPLWWAELEILSTEAS